MFAKPCPCGSGRSLDQCCGPIVDGTQPAETAEALMRSRYTAFVLCDDFHLFRSWHPRTRPAQIVTDPSTRWLGLRVLDTTEGGPENSTGEVEFEARYDDGAGEVTLHERSSFARRAGRWVYVEALA